jgi:predicted enzyme related to lactoylglutathione lyase
MSERTQYAPGTPSWTDHASPDPGAAAGFYSDLFGWRTENRMPADSEGEYHMAELDGKSVAALGSQPMEGMPPVWNTYISVESADEAARRARDAGGDVVMDPFDVFDAGRMAVCSDQAGAVFMVWEPKEMIGAERVNDPGTLTWTELVTRDVDGSKDFYGAVFGWTPNAMDAGEYEYTVWNLGESGVGGMMPISGERFPADMPPHWLVYFAVEDADATARRADELDGRIEKEPFDGGAGRIAILADPVGAVFGVIALSDEMRAQAP